MKKAALIFVPIIALGLHYALAQSSSSEGDVVSSCISLTSTLTYGNSDAATGGQVSMLQDFLIEKGKLSTPTGGPTGYYGMKTVVAVKVYQASKGITQTGSVGPLTRAAVANDTGCSTGSGNQNNSTNTNAQNTIGASASTSPVSTTLSTAAGSYLVYVNGRIVANGTATRSDAVSQCAANRAGNPNVSISCYWNNTQIYSYYPIQASSDGTSAAVFGAGPGGIPGNQPITYAWYAWAGSMLLTQTPRNLGYADPTVACTASNVGATYYLGRSSTLQNVVAKCLASNQSLTDFVPLSATTINRPGSIATSTIPTTLPCAVIGPSTTCADSAPITYSWRTYAGSMLGSMSASATGFSEPSVACTASNVGATYYLGRNGAGDQYAECLASNTSQTSYVQPTANTINRPGSAAATSSPCFVTGAGQTCSTAAPACSYTRGTFTNAQNGDLTEWATGSASCTVPPSDATGWVSVGDKSWHRVLSHTTVPMCSWTTGSFPVTGGTTNWACGSAECTGAPAGSGWVDQGNGCYHQPASQ